MMFARSRIAAPSRLGPGRSNPGGEMFEKGNETVLVLQHTVKKGMEQRYKEWLTRIPETLQGAAGFIGRDVFPPSLADRPYTIVVRFADTDSLRDWLDSDEHKTLRAESMGMLDQGDRPEVTSGFDLWLSPEPNPKRYKLLVVTVVAIFPLSLLIPQVLAHFFDNVAPTLKGSIVNGIAQTAVISALLSYAIMPRLTHKLRHWLLGSVSKEKLE